MGVLGKTARCKLRSSIFEAKFCGSRAGFCLSYVWLVMEQWVKTWGPWWTPSQMNRFLNIYRGWQPNYQGLVEMVLTHSQWGPGQKHCFRHNTYRLYRLLASSFLGCGLHKLNHVGQLGCSSSWGLTGKCLISFLSMRPILTI